MVAGDGRACSARERLPPAALARLQQHDWPGNIRELRNSSLFKRLKQWGLGLEED